MTDVNQVADFYQSNRRYWMEMGAFRSKHFGHMLNFGYWVPGVQGLGDAQRAMMGLIESQLPLHDAASGVAGLEIGCGIGGVSIYLLQHHAGLRMTALDIVQSQLELAQGNAAQEGVADRLVTCQGNSMALPFGDGCVDFSLCVESSFHYEDKQKFFAEIARVVRPGGVVVVADITCTDRSALQFNAHHHFEEESAYRRYAEQAGLTCALVQDIGRQVFVPLYEHIVAFNATRERSRLGRYWALIAGNYKSMAEAGKLGYCVFAFRKPGG